ncbi:MAG: hypothetical protein OEN23_08825 [Paracoccaceae bacterium]|nr:hypothetical protein [Paracoccaceae bacterium]
MSKSKRTLTTRGRGTGRPYSVTAPGREVVEKMLANGCSRATVAATLGISETALANAATRDPDLSASIERGDGALETELVGHLLAHAREGNVTAAIFLLKAKRHFRDSTPVEPKTDRPNITINLPGAASPEDYARMIDVTPDQENQQRNKA